MTKLDQHRKEVLTNLKYIKERVDDNYDHLLRINGRLRNAENAISWIKGIGTTITFVIGIILTWFKFDK